MNKDIVCRAVPDFAKVCEIKHNRSYFHFKGVNRTPSLFSILGARNILRRPKLLKTKIRLITENAMVLMKTTEAKNRCQLEGKNGRKHRNLAKVHFV